jgi:hypothetical protein
MRENRSGRARLFLLGSLAALALGMTFASSASASPAWKFNGTALVGVEEVIGSASGSTLTIPGMITTCNTVSYEMRIVNTMGTGTGEVRGMQFEECSTNTVCTVESIVATSLPWPLSLKTIGGNDYVVVKNVKVEIEYGNPECALEGITGIVTGSAGGLFQNPTSTIAFSPASFKATGTELKMFGTKVDWTATFSTQATGAHAGEALEG